MPAFEYLDWSRFDVWAVVANGGLVTIDDRSRGAAHDWLRRHGYAIGTIDFGGGLAGAIPVLGKLFEWEQQFGYTLTADHCNLDALRDGFLGFRPPSAKDGWVLELLRPEAAWREDGRWLSGLLSIALENSLQELALGRRFFALLVTPEDSPPVGQEVERVTVPGHYRNLG